VAGVARWERRRRSKKRGGGAGVVSPRGEEEVAGRWGEEGGEGTVLIPWHI